MDTRTVYPLPHRDGYASVSRIECVVNVKEHNVAIILHVNQHVVDLEL
jgi:hypothetical protein